MGHREMLLSRIEVAERELARLDAITARFGEDNYNRGSVIVFDKRFRDDQTYNYAAIKAHDDLWYTTGPKSTRGYNWEELCAFMAQGVGKVYWASEFEEIKP